MNWTITIKPTSSALTSWTWTAVRDDQENVLYGDPEYASVNAARTSARAAAQAYENDVIAIETATITEPFTPEGVNP